MLVIVSKWKLSDIFLPNALNYCAFIPWNERLWLISHEGGSIASEYSTHGREKFGFTFSTTMLVTDILWVSIVTIQSWFLVGKKMFKPVSCLQIRHYTFNLSCYCSLVTLALAELS